MDMQTNQCSRIIFIYVEFVTNGLVPHVACILSEISFCNYSTSMQGWVKGGKATFIISLFYQISLSLFVLQSSFSFCNS